MFSKTKRLAAAVLALLWLLSPVANAQYTSPNYRVDQTFFGAGGELQMQSPNYQARSAVGELGVDHSSSANFQAYSGYNTTSDPLLEVVVTGGTYDFGTLSTSQTKAITTIFNVRNYLSSGYVVRVGGTPPKNNSGPTHELCAMSSGGCSSTTSTPGTEQFGINLAANNIPGPVGPGAFGAAPQQLPDSSFGFGTAAAGYNTANSFKYAQNDTIASSAKSSGTTSYTLSAIANISTITPGGAYGTSLFINVIPTF